MLQPFFTQENQKIIFTRQQASKFAKTIAEDFNPLHDEDNKRFCVPGDLLFSIVLAQYGINQQMSFNFEGMVREGIYLNLLAFENGKLSLKDENDKTYLSVNATGNNYQNQLFIENFTREYVKFSGQTFPHILVPLMRKEGLMINPARPMVIYQNMEINLDQFGTDKVSLGCLETSIEINGKRGKVKIEFCIKSNDKIIGHGEKNLIISGLRPFDETSVKEMVDGYNALKTAYQII